MEILFVVRCHVVELSKDSDNIDTSIVYGRPSEHEVFMCSSEIRDWVVDMDRYNEYNNQTIYVCGVLIDNDMGDVDLTYQMYSDKVYNKRIKGLLNDV